MPNLLHFPNPPCCFMYTFSLASSPPPPPTLTHMHSPRSTSLLLVPLGAVPLASEFAAPWSQKTSWPVSSGMPWEACSRTTSQFRVSRESNARCVLGVEETVKSTLRPS